MANTTGKKFGGREKGTPNRLTRDSRILLKNILYKELDNFEEYFENLETKQKLEIIIKLLPYVMPKIETVHYTENEPNVWEW
jgi:hypothetical protein